MKKLQAGFTLVELVVVIAVLGVLSAIAIPKYVNFKADAANAATKGVAGALASASAIHYAAHVLNPKVELIKTCELSTGLLLTKPPSNFTYSGTAPTCTVSNNDGGEDVTWNMSQ